jgi:hypothetical protein
MLLRFVRSLILLCVVLMGFNTQANAQAFNSPVIASAASDFSTAISLNNVSAIHATPVQNNPIASLLSTTAPDTLFRSDIPISIPEHSYQFTLPENSSSSSTGRFVLNQPEPDYQVEIELSIPACPSLIIGYAVIISPHQCWLMQAAMSRSKISGWKDSNQLYAQRVYPRVTAFA